ncbi:MAG TPA: N-methyl-L-tryptophan oxidase [Streptosporangiaceae bacterium]|jgi:sarcosine oxidase
MTVVEADVVVIGAGSVGSMAAWQLAARGLRVVGIDRFTVPGPFSAYAGESRVFRMVYAEGGHYTPLLQRARGLWRELEAASGASLLSVTGVVTITDHDHPSHAALLRAGQEQGLSFEVVSGEEARRRLPQHVIRDGDVALLDPAGGFVRSEHAVFAALRQAERGGASFLGNRNVTGLDRHGDRWSVRTDQEEVRAPRVLVATGTGAGPACAALGTHLAVLPQVLTWFPVADQDLLRSQPEQVFIRISRDAQYYGFPSADGWTVKVAASIYLDEVASMARPPAWDPRHLDTVRAWVRAYLPALDPQPVRAVLCADGYTPDEAGLLGPVPGMDGVIVATGFSGHGFKMAASLGAVAADLIASGTTATDISFLDPARFLPPGQELTDLPLGGAAPRQESS